MASGARTRTDRALVLAVGVDAAVVASALATARHSFECEEASDAARAIQRARVRPPDLVVIGGPAARAAAITEALLEDPATDGASLVAWPADDERTDRARLVALGPRVAPRSGAGLRQACDEALDARDGRTVLVELPAARTRGASDSPEGVDLREKRVIVADDDPAIVWFFADLLRGAGCEVDEAADGAHALELAHRSPPDIVLTDIRMPVLDGIRLCHLLRADPILADVPVVLLSWREDWLSRACNDEGCGSAYLTKHSTPEEVLACVENVLIPYARLERRMRSAGPIRGRLDGISPYRILRLACTTRRDARVTLRDRTHFYEVLVRGGAPRTAACLATDGSMTCGNEALSSMLAARTGRFGVTPENGLVDGELRGTLLEQIAAHVATSRGVQSSEVCDPSIIVTVEAPERDLAEGVHAHTAEPPSESSASPPEAAREESLRTSSGTMAPASQALQPRREPQIVQAPHPQSPRRTWRPALRWVALTAIALVALAAGAGARVARRSAVEDAQEDSARSGTPAASSATNTRASRVAAPHPR
jgi:CheY-like chemotaxis protein